MKINKVFIWVAPLFIILLYQFFSGEAASAEGINKLFQALHHWGPSLALNTVRIGLVLVLLLLCGMRIFIFISEFLKVNTQPNVIAAIMTYLLLGSLFSFLLLMSIGIIGIYNPVTTGSITLLLIFCPYRFKESILHLIKTIRKIKIQSTFDTHLFFSAFIFFGIPLLLLQLTSIVPAWMDILEVYVAPVQRVISFGQYLPADALPFSFYNASRSVPLFTAIYTYIGTLSGLPSYAAISGSSIYILFFSLIAFYFTVNALIKGSYGGITAWLFSLSYNFLNIHHGRSGSLIPIFLISSIGFIFQIINAETDREKLLYAILSGLGIGSIAILHPLLGMYSFGLVVFLTLMLMICFTPGFFFLFIYLISPASLISASLLFQAGSMLHLGWNYSLVIWSSLFITSLILLKGYAAFFKKNLIPDIIPASRFVNIRLPVITLTVIIGLVCCLPWHYQWFNETPMHFLFTRFPLLLCFTFFAVIRLIVVYLQNTSSPRLSLKIGTALLLIAGIFILQALPLYILPFFRLDNFISASLSAELPTKALYWVSPLLIIFSPLCIYGIKKAVSQHVALFILQSLIVTVPLFFTTASGFTGDAIASWQSVAEMQLKLAANGYFHGWDGEPRQLLCADSFKLIDYLKQLIASGQLHIQDTIYHIAQEQHPWAAIPFPAFCGVRQSLLLVKRSPNDINTRWGRITDFPTDFYTSVPKKWVLIEKNVISLYPDFFKQFQKKYQLKFENKRVLLYERTNFVFFQFYF